VNVELQRVTKVYDGRPVLARVSLRLRRGECLLLCGPNGSGKSTLLKMIATLVRPTAGQLLYDGKPAGEWGPALRRRIGVLSHESFLYPELTAEENLVWTARLYGLDRPHAAAVQALERVGLAAFRREPAGHFSRGMRQRLSLARSLLASPDLVLWDEPYEGLDRRAVQRLEDALGELRRAGRTIVIVAHQWERVWPWADRVAYLRAGYVVEEGERAAMDAQRWEALFAQDGASTGDELRAGGKGPLPARTSP